jgi:hypothetical protein
MYIIMYSESSSEGLREEILTQVGDSIPLRFKDAEGANNYIHRHRLYDVFDNIRPVLEEN